MFKTLATMEQETGFSFHKELGENFLAGKVAAEELEEKLRKNRYSEYWGMVLGLAVAFGIQATNKGYEEILNSVKEFVSKN